MFNPNRKINHAQKCLTAPQYREMVKNHKTRKNADVAHPVVKFFDPFGASTWLLTELDPETGIAYGLCDLGQGFPEFGNVSLDEMCAIGRINRDLHFKGDRKTLEQWKEHAELHGLIGA